MCWSILFSQMSLYKTFLKQSLTLNAVLVEKKKKKEWLENECEKIFETTRVFNTLNLYGLPNSSWKPIV